MPPAEPTEIDFAPLGNNVMLLVPASTAPEKLMSLAVIEMAELVVDKLPVAPLVTLPVPSAVIVIPLVPVAELLMIIAPLEPDDVCSTNVVPEMALDVVTVPLPVRVRAPLVEVRVPDVPIVAEAPVVVTVKLPPTDDAPKITAPVLEIVAAPGLPVLTLKVETAVSIGVPTVPIEPVPDVKVSVPVVRVTAPVLVIVPEPLALRLMVPAAPVEALAVMEMPELLPLVAKLTVAVPEIDIALLTVSVPPELTVTLLVVPLTAPRLVVLEEPNVLMVRDLLPRVIVCPDDVNAPPLLN